MVGSVLSSLAWNMDSLIVFRVVQGVGGGLMLPIMQNLFVGAAGGKALGRAMAVVSVPVLLGPILGPVIGGLIISHLSWLWMFWVNVPFCVIGFALAWWGLPADAKRTRQPLDVLGLALLSPALAALIYGLTQIGIKGDFAHEAVIMPLVLGIALLDDLAGAHKQSACLAVGSKRQEEPCRVTSGSVARAAAMSTSSMSGSLRHSAARVADDASG